MPSRRVKCRECGTRFTCSSVGRPPVYCSTTCRRSAEYTVRRNQALLKRAEAKVQDAEVKVVTQQAWRQVNPDKVLVYWRAEVERLQVVLRASLAGVSTTEEESDGMG